MSAPSTNGLHLPDVHMPTNSVDFEAQAEQMTVAMRDQIAAMRALLDNEVAGRSHLEQLLDDSKEREKRLVRAVAVLEGGVNNHAITAKPKKPSKPAAKDNGWNVSEATVQRIWAAFQRYATEVAGGEPFTQTSMAAWMTANGEGVGGDTIRKSMLALRERELVRVAGTTRGGGKLWAPMPDHGA
jgi:predicted phage tail protein